MSRYLLVFLSLVLVATCVRAGDEKSVDPASKQLCTDVWYQSIDKQIATSAVGKHGPEVGSDEWKSVVELKLSVRGKGDVPERSSESWCRYIDELVHADGKAGNVAPTPKPSYSCDKVKPDSIESAICNDKELSALDSKLAGVYAEAEKKAAEKPGSSQALDPQAWVKVREECAKSEDMTACIRDAYFRRIAELEAIYQLIPGIGPVFYQCGGNPPSEVVILFFETDPRTLVAKRKGNSSLMYVVPSGSGTRYQGRNETFWEHQGEASIVWGIGAPQMRCKKAS